ncbi:MAG: hypothetical protein M1830_005850 [Pleopsidium flavum]|nr:MAG: hypothetical protein M1830_005850 [Pleopsidium flavum]
MFLQINLQSSRCKPGDQLVGTIELQGPNHLDVGVESVKIQVQGRCKTKFTKHEYGQSISIYRGRAPLCLLELSVFKGPGTLHPPQTLPFSFEMPERCNASGTDSFHASPQFNTEYNQILPPSFDVAHQSLLEGKEIKAFISYELEATAILEKAVGPGPLKARQKLDVIPTRDIENPDPGHLPHSRSITCASLHLIPEYEKRDPTFKERIKIRFSSDTLPVAVFKLNVTMPKVVILGQALPLSVGIEYDNDKSTAETPPMIFLIKATVTLRAETGIRCIGSLFSSHDKSEKWTKEQVISSPYFNKPIPVSDGMDLGKIMDLRLGTARVQDSKLWSSPCPTFKTFNIRRSYSLSVFVAVECARKRYNYDSKVHDFLMLAEDFAPAKSTASAVESSGERVVKLEAADSLGLQEGSNVSSMDLSIPDFDVSAR